MWVIDAKKYIIITLIISVMQKICFVMPYHILDNRGGGAEVQAWLLAKELARRGYDVTYIAQSTRKTYTSSEMISGVKIKWIKYIPKFFPLAWRNFLNRLKDEKPDFVIQRGSMPEISWAAGKYSRKSGAKFIWICSDNSSPFKWVSLKNQIRAIRKGGSKIYKLIFLTMNAFILDILRHYGMRNVFVAFNQNDYQQKILKREFGLDSHRIVSGHEFPAVLNAPGMRLDKGIVLWVGNLGERKRPEKYIELARRAKRENLEFVMIGTKDDKSYVDKLFENAPPNLEWLGHLSFEETLEWFRRAAFFVNTSEKEKEGFPNTYIQAWLRGVPVFTLEVDPSEIIQTERLGFVENNLSKILDKFRYFQNRRDEYAEFSKRVQEYARAHHSIEIMADSFLKAVCDLIK